MLSSLQAIIERLGETEAGVTKPAIGGSPGPRVEQGGPSLAAQVMAIVAEKTGYPVEMLRPEMELEADLGIDSIKRVEILAATEERISGLPRLAPHELGMLSSLQAIIERLGGGATPQAVPQPSVPLLGSGPLTRLERSGEVCPLATKRGGTKAGSMTVGIHGGTPEERSCLVQACRGRGVQLAVEGAPAQALLVLSTLQAGPGTAGALRQAMELVSLLQNLAAQPPRRLVALHRLDGQSYLASAMHHAAWCGGIAPLLRTAAAELPGLSATAIDIGDAPLARVVEQVLDEALCGDPEPEVALTAAGLRLVSREREAPLAHAAVNGLAMPDRPALLVSGGARGIAAACLIALSKELRPRLALLGRTALPKAPFPHDDVADAGNALRDAILADAAAQGTAISPRDLMGRLSSLRAQREIRDTLRALEDAGAETIYLSLDIRDRDAVDKAATTARQRWGRIDGIIHAAGALADRHIADKTPEQLELVIGTKVTGLENLLSATRDDALRFLICFGSVAGRYGNAGQSDYAYANGVLAAMAQGEARRRGDACLVRNLGWGPWEGGMVDAALRHAFQQRGIEVIGYAEGAAAFLAELQAPPGTGEADVVLMKSVARRA
jgi:NAD(P)-dependent dehydrogenase (short-subunit alcohol dehydrogenase family)